MAQKNKVKELVGRGLNSYHTKALQQMDRIEKKNKEQNHKISILSNELDNDYLTKTEEGSVVSLEHSKEGMVYLDELQGNTLVNYCTDGSKELTLNGDIDVEGVSVTTTEGVDGGKIDVMCEGNTLVNLFNRATLKIQEKSNRLQCDNLENRNMYKASKYTFVNLSNKMVQPNMYTKSPYVWQKSYRVAPNSKMVIELLDNQELTEVVWNYSDGWTENDISYAGNTFLILEGDWTNKEVPQSYFEGMKSVGQNDENGHKIEISSSVGKENLIKDSDIYIEQSDTFKTFNSSYQNIIDKVQNKTITISVDIEVEDMIPRTDGRNRIGCELSVVYEDDTRGYHGIWYTGENFKGRQARTFSITKKIKTIDYFGIYIQCAGKKHKIGRPKIEIGDTNTNWCPSSNDNLNGLQTFMNKKEILINEPLRSVGNTKDKFVKIGGKWFIEKKCEEIVFDGSDDEKWSFKVTEPSGKYSYKIDPAIVGSTNGRLNGICDKFTFVNWNSNPWNYKSNCISILSNGVYVYTDFTTLSEFKTWLQSNPFTLICELATPVYEPLEIEPTLNTYNDITHISNNSIIPCNMKIKNSGYNAIIKPSTLYTVALDTNKSGTVGMNLGGAKGTTTNNVLKLTTPATLTDDSLRLYGKGIKGSKVRLLEGDKTNWIPSFFEGMKSSFEDKVQDDGSYKMEILSNNKNLFDGKFEQGYISSKTGLLVKSSDSYSSVNFINVKNINKITISYTSVDIRPTIGVARYDENYNFIDFFQSGVLSQCKQTVDVSNCHYIKFRLYQQVTDISKIISCQVEKGSVETNYVQHLSNKIQFSSIEPLRSVGDTKDKFMFKGDKLVIERNCKKVIFNGSESWSMYSSTVPNSELYYLPFNEKNKDTHLCKCNLFATKIPDGNHLWNTEGEGIGYKFGNKCFRLRVNKIRGVYSAQDLKQWLSENPISVVYPISEPTYEEIPFELQKIILEGYENGTLFIDTNIPPTSTVTYAGETPIVKATKLNKTEVSSNTDDINDNIIPYLMDMDYRVVCLQLQLEEFNGGISMARLFGGAYEMLQRDIQSKRYSTEEYKYRLDAYLSANKITEEEYNKLGDMLNE